MSRILVLLMSRVVWAKKFKLASHAVSNWDLTENHNRRENIAPPNFFQQTGTTVAPSDYLSNAPGMGAIVEIHNVLDR